VILELVGQVVRSDQDVNRIMANVRQGQALDLVLWRDGQTLRTTLQL
jgi:hypothetical protein